MIYALLADFLARPLLMLRAALPYLVLIAGLALVPPTVAVGISCPSEDSTVSRVGLPACVWWAPVQGNGQGRIVVNWPGEMR